MFRELDHNRLKAAPFWIESGGRMKLTNATIPGGKRGAIAIGMLSLVVTFAVLANAAHAASPTSTTSGNSNVADPDQGAACTGSGESQQGECDTQTGDQTGPDANISDGLSGLEG